MLATTWKQGEAFEIYYRDNNNDVLDHSFWPGHQSGGGSKTSPLIINVAEIHSADLDTTDYTLLKTNDVFDYLGTDIPNITLRKLLNAVGRMRGVSHFDADAQVKVWLSTLFARIGRGSAVKEQLELVRARSGHNCITWLYKLLNEELGVQANQCV